LIGGDAMIVRSKRRTLVKQALLIVVAGVFVGWAVEAWRLLPMSRMSARVGWPVALVFFSVTGLVVAIVSARDYWGHRIEFAGDHIRIVDFLGSVRIYYNQIEYVRVIRLYGAGIKLKPGVQWLNTFEGTAGARRKKENISAIWQRGYGCEVCLHGKVLDIGVEPFVDELCKRSTSAVEAPRDQA
jgi:hypothetical protein